MAWTTLSFSFGSTLPSSKLTSMQANFTALAQGLSGAPKIKTAALNQVSGAEAVTTATMRAASVTLIKLPLYAAGTYVEAATSGSYNCTVANTSYLQQTYTMPRGGTLRIQAYAYGPNQHGDILLYKNGVYTGYNCGGSSSYAGITHSNFPVDLSFSAGDTISFYVANNVDGEDTVWKAFLMADIGTVLVPRPTETFVFLENGGTTTI